MTYWNRIDTVAVLLAFLGAVAPAATAQQPAELQSAAPAAPCTTTSDDATIYSAALRETVLKGRDDSTRIVLASQTSAALPPGMASSSYTSQDEQREVTRLAASATRKDFDSKSALQCDVSKDIEPIGRVTLFNPKDRSRYFNAGGADWKALYQKYPHSTGLTVLSAIGFDAPHNQALVYVGNSCNLLCGTGYWVLLEKKHDKWSVVKTTILWTAGPASE
jgi:hypothetical protein